MDVDPSDRSPLQDPIVRGLLGFFGVIFGLMFLPRALAFFFRRFVFGTISEVVAVILTGLLTEKAAGWLARREP